MPGCCHLGIQGTVTDAESQRGHFFTTVSARALRNAIRLAQQDGETAIAVASNKHAFVDFFCLSLAQKLPCFLSLGFVLAVGGCVQHERRKDRGPRALLHKTANWLSKIAASCILGWQISVDRTRHEHDAGQTGQIARGGRDMWMMCFGSKQRKQKHSKDKLVSEIRNLSQGVQTTPKSQAHLKRLCTFVHLAKPAVQLLDMRSVHSWQDAEEQLQQKTLALLKELLATKLAKDGIPAAECCS